MDKCVNIKELPFAGYIMSLDEEKGRQLKRRIELHCGFSEATTTRYLRGSIRPNRLNPDAEFERTKREILEVLERV